MFGIVHVLRECSFSIIRVFFNEVTQIKYSVIQLRTVYSKDEVGKSRSPELETPR